MKWQEAVAASPEGEAFRYVQPGQICWTRGPGDTYRMKKPNYAMYEDVRQHPRAHEDWEPVGWHKARLEARRGTVADVTDHESVGFLAPDGTFYRCAPTDHRPMASGLCHILGVGVDGAKLRDPEEVLKKAGWAVLKRRHDALWFAPRAPTQAQRDAVWDWSRAQGRTRMPVLFWED